MAITIGGGISLGRGINVVTYSPPPTPIFDLDAANYSAVPTNGTYDATGTYTLAVTNAGSISYNSANGGYWTKSNTTGTDVIVAGPAYTGTTQSYTVFLAYNLTATNGTGRLLNTAVESNPADWLMGGYTSTTNYKNAFFTGGTGEYNVDSYTGTSDWRFIWGSYNSSSGIMNSYIASSTENTSTGPTAFYKQHTGMSGAHGFNQLRFWSRAGGVEVQTGSIAFVKIYSTALSISQIQSLHAAYKARFF